MYLCGVTKWIRSMRQNRNISAKRQTKERKLWRNITIASFAAVVVSLLFLGCIAFLVSILFMLVAYGQYDSRKPYKDGGHTPWYYGAL